MAARGTGRATAAREVVITRVFDGSFLFCMRAPDGRELAFHGGYREIVPPER